MSDEITSMNLSDLDIEELERRIELGLMIPPSEGSNDCVTQCGTMKPN